MSTITPHYRSIQQLLQSQSFSIDEYQREYKWDAQNIDELLTDLLSKFFVDYQPGDETSAVSAYGEYFLGSIIVSNRNGHNYLIDGQQRVTSLTLLLIYLYRTAREWKLPVAQTIAPLIYSDNLGQTQFNLDIPERLSVIKALFDGTPFASDGKDESIQGMYAMYHHIAESSLLDELSDGFQHFAYWLLTRVGMIEIATSNDSYAQEIFETMNDRGQPLSPVDMLKAYLLATIEDRNKSIEANSRWKREIQRLNSFDGDSKSERSANFIKAWFRAQYAESIRERKAGARDKDWELIGSVFHRWVRDHSDRIGVGRAVDNHRMMTERLPFFADAYLLILSASQNYTRGLEAVYYNAHNDFTWQPTVLLAPLVDTDDALTVRRKLAVTAAYLDIWIMRRTVNYFRVAYSYVSYAMWLLSKDIRQKSLSDLVAILEQKLADDDVTFDGSKKKRERIGIQDLRLNQSSKRYVYHLLARLTAVTEIGAGRADPFPELVDRQAKNPYDIEHIWPNNYSTVAKQFQDEQEFQNWRDHVASLLLLPADVNRSLQDKTFVEKRKHYAKQNFYAASLDSSVYQHQPQFRDYMKQHALPYEAFQNFTKDEQRRRFELVEALVELIWSPDRLRQAAKQ